MYVYVLCLECNGSIVNRDAIDSSIFAFKM